MPLDPAYKAGVVGHAPATSEARDFLLPVELPMSYIFKLKKKESSLVMGNNIRTFLFLIFMIVAFIGVFYIRAFLTRRAIFKVIDIFYKHHALGMNGAKTPHELGLESQNFIQRITRPRDYKQYALQILIKREIILLNEEGRLYMVEEKLEPALRKKRSDLFSH